MKFLWASGCFVLENQIVHDFPSFVLPQAGRKIPKDSISNWSEDPSWVPHFKKADVMIAQWLSWAS